ncbi:MAG: O-antigen ligase family protein [Gaiellaceae bacterium]
MRASPLRAGLLAVAGLVVGGSLLVGGGSSPRPVFWLGTLAVVAVAVAWALARPPFAPDQVALLALFGAVGVWSAVTIVWSIQPDRSWESFNRTVLYVAALGLGLLAGATPRRAAALLAALFALTLAWALAGAVVPALGADVERSARLREPVEYWNALALVAAMALPLWLWLRRPLGAVAAFATVVALLLTTSRGGVLVAIVAAAAWLALVRPRTDAVWTLLIAVPAGIAVGAWALTTSLAEPGTAGDGRAGALLGVALAAGGTLVLALVRRPAPAWAGRVAAGVAVAGAIGLFALAVPRLDDAWGEFRNPPAVQVTNEPGRLADVSSNHRWTWWTQAWTIFRDHPAGGTGAGTYELARRPIREDTLGPLDPHNLGLKALSDTGIVGFLLLLGAVAAAAWVVVGALRRTAGEERVAAAALAAGAAAWLAQSLIDMPFEYAAATVPVTFGLGVLAGAGREPVPRRAALVPAVAALALVASLAFPWLADRRAEASLDALTAGDYRTAAAAAQDAQALDPLAVQPLHLEAVALELEGRLDEAERVYEEAAELQPRNPQAWYELGRFEYEARGDLERALLYLDRSWNLDRQSPDTGPLLDVVRAELASEGRG